MGIPNTHVCPCLPLPIKPVLWVCVCIVCRQAILQISYMALQMARVLPVIPNPPLTLSLAATRWKVALKGHAAGRPACRNIRLQCRAARLPTMPAAQRACYPKV